VLDTGKNVAPGPIEDEFATSDCVEQAMVIGDKEKFVGALFVPNFDALERWAEAEDVDLADDPEVVCEDERAREWVKEAVDEVNADLEKHERIKEFRLIPEEWTPENDMLTPSMKKKRRKILDSYSEQVADIYGRAEAEEATADD
jgi:long-chain acyl-CoA synthetase